MGRGKGKETVEMIKTVRDILAASHYPLTLRRLYYELISKGVIDNSAKSYSALITKMTAARWDGDIPVTLLDKIVDGGRKPRRVPTWRSIEDYAASAAYFYETDRWDDQSAYVELWVEKEAVVSILADTCEKNQIVFRPLHGFNSFTAVHQTAKDLLEVHKNITIFYLGDHDTHGYPTDEDKVFAPVQPEAAPERLCALGSKCLRSYKRKAAVVTGRGLFCSSNCKGAAAAAKRRKRTTADSLVLAELASQTRMNTGAAGGVFSSSAT
ncbi:MAG: hypothetical protein WA637_13175, partial [Terriglobales bacterium]